MRSYTKDYEFHGPLFAGKGCVEKTGGTLRNQTKDSLEKSMGKKAQKKSLWKSDTLRSTNIAMENPPILDVFPIGKGGFPLLC